MQKLVAYIKWFVIEIPLGIFGLITSPIFYPLWELTHWKIFWIWDDATRFRSDGKPAGDYQVYLDKYSNGVETFWVKYRWHVLRNRIWNLIDLIAKSKTGDGSGITNKEFVIDNMTIDGKKVQDGGRWPMTCGLKYKVKEGQDPWQGWVGDVIDLKYSIIGEGMMWFKQDGVLSFRYSHCKIKPYLFFWKRWRTFKISIVKNNTTLSFKYQKLNKE